MKKKNEIVDLDVNQERLIGDTETKTRKLAEHELGLKKLELDKINLSYQIESKKARNLINELIAEEEFEQLLTQYENNKKKDSLEKLTEEFNKLDPIFSKEEHKSELWQTLTKRYNAIIESE